MLENPMVIGPYYSEREYERPDPDAECDRIRQLAVDEDAETRRRANRDQHPC